MKRTAAGILRETFEGEETKREGHKHEPTAQTLCPECAQAQNESSCAEAGAEGLGRVGRG